VGSCPYGVRALNLNRHNKRCSWNEVFYPDVSVIVGYTEVEGGFMNWLFGGGDVVKWQSAQGFVITPLDTHIVSAIVGLYFGAGFTK
jgi:hypothetical protein